MWGLCPNPAVIMAPRHPNHTLLDSRTLEVNSIWQLLSCFKAIFTSRLNGTFEVFLLMKTRRKLFLCFPAPPVCCLIIQLDSPVNKSIPFLKQSLVGKSSVLLPLFRHRLPALLLGGSPLAAANPSPRTLTQTESPELGPLVYFFACWQGK